MKKSTSRITSKKKKTRPMQTTLYALMVGIDNYPIAHHKLNGCVNDRNALKDYLERRFDKQSGKKPNIKTLTDADATKRNVIEAFSHFDKAKDGDICLFYFSGHGSQAPAPKEFWHLDPDRMNESILCYDSRIGGTDMMDKELSYLIWKATQNKKVHFVAIFDCCHSGTITREAGSGYTARMAEPSATPRDLKDYVGFTDYKVTKEAGFEYASPPRGTYIQLAACKEQETAKETQINGKTRGLFTYNLIEVLEQSGNQLSYAELLQILQIRIANRVAQQTPQLITVEQDANQLFLGGKMTVAEPYFLIQFAKGKWVMNGGTVQGIPPEGCQVTLEDKAKVSLKKVGANQSDVDGMGSRDTSKAYKAFAKGLKFKTLKVAYSPDSAADGKRILDKALKNTSSSYFAMVNKPADADFWIRCVDNTFRLTKPDDKRPVFRRMEGFSEMNASLFINNIETVAKWRNVLDLSNPKTTIQKDEFDIELYRITEPGNITDNASAEKVDWKQTNVFRYELVGGEWQQPAFRMKVKNTGRRDLFFSAINLEANFKVSNRFLPIQELKPGQEAWLLDVYQNQTFKTIPLEVADAFHSWGITESREYFKVIISTDPALNTDLYNQEKLELDVAKSGEVEITRAGRTESTTPNEPDWMACDVELLIVRPMEQQKLESGRSVEMTDTMSIKAPQGVSANVMLSTVSETSRGVVGTDAMPAPQAFYGSRSVAAPYEFLPGNMHAPGLSVLELREVSGKEKISADTPLTVDTRQTMSQEEMIIPLGYDIDSGMYYPLGFSNDAGEVTIETLPEESPTGTRSLGGSIKIFFQKVVLTKLGFEPKHPQLAMAVFTEGEEYIYETDTAKIEAAVKNAQNIVLMTHGIIGDTLEMPKSLKRIGQYPYDLVLTFDYENLSTEIQDTARELKEHLRRVGLKKGHGKQLTIIAHSMGGLVSRWFIEKEGGREVITHLIQVGTPNMGSPWADVYELSSVLLSRVINGAAFLQPYLFALNLLGKVVQKVFTTLQQMNDDSEFMQLLNDKSDPGIPYTIIAGNTKLIPAVLEEKHNTLLKRILARFRQRAHFDALDILLFKEENDIAVAVKSIYGIPGMEKRQFVPREFTVACDHISYFGDPEGLKALSKAIQN